MTRTVSKTFDVTLMEYYVALDIPLSIPVESEITIQPHRIVMRINVGARKLSQPNTAFLGFCYLRKHPFKIEFSNENSGVYNTIEIENGYDSDPSINVDFYSNTFYAEITLESFDTGSQADVMMDTLNTYQNSSAYLTDITGLTRQMLNTGNGFNHTYCFIDGN